jgi:hypothetical protein
MLPATPPTTPLDTRPAPLLDSRPQPCSPRRASFAASPHPHIWTCHHPHRTPSSRRAPRTAASASASFQPLFCFQGAPRAPPAPSCLEPFVSGAPSAPPSPEKPAVSRLPTRQATRRHAAPTRLPGHPAAPARPPPLPAGPLPAPVPASPTPNWRATSSNRTAALSTRPSLARAQTSLPHRCTSHSLPPPPAALLWATYPFASRPPWCPVPLIAIAPRQHAAAASSPHASHPPWIFVLRPHGGRGAGAPAHRGPARTARVHPLQSFPRADPQARGPLALFPAPATGCPPSCRRAPLAGAPWRAHAPGPSPEVLHRGALRRPSPWPPYPWPARTVKSVSRRRSFGCQSKGVGGAAATRKSPRATGRLLGAPRCATVAPSHRPPTPPRRRARPEQTLRKTPSTS